jgi:hypothetical protein
VSLESQIKKLFSEIQALNKKLGEMDNGKFDEMRRQMARVSADSQVVVSTVKSHGDVLEKLGKRLTRLDLRCPLMRPDTSEFEKVGG